MGADSAAISNYDLVIRKDPKLFMVGPYGIGFTDSFRMGQILGYGFKPPMPPSRGDLMHFMCTDWIDSVRKVMKHGGFAKITEGVEEGGFFLVAIKGRIFNIGNDYQVGENVLGFDACGCGEPYAMAAMYVMKGNAEIRVRTALETASKFSSGVHKPFRLMNVPK